MDKIGAYQILEIVHRGPQPLYRAKAADGRVVALKVIPVAGLSPESRERFLRETETCRTLDHPNLVRVYDSGDVWVLRFAAQGKEGGEVRVTRAQLAGDGWNVVIPEQVGAQLRANGAPDPP